jgi:hypothetical protein
MKIKFGVLIAVMSIVLLTATQVMASSSASNVAKRKPEQTPGANGPGHSGGNNGRGGQEHGNNGKGRGHDKDKSGEQDDSSSGTELVHRVGVVVDYQPGVSITVQDRFGNQSTFLINGDNIKILPKKRADSLGVGSYVTIIAPRDPKSDNTLLMALGIVIHPHAPTSFPTGSPTPESTLTGSETPTETVTPTETPTETPTSTPTETPTETSTSTPTATATP